MNKPSLLNALLSGIVTVGAVFPIMQANAASQTPNLAYVYRTNATSALTIQVLSDELIHFDYSARESAPNPAVPLPATPLIAQTSFAGPSTVTLTANGFETAAAVVEIDATSLCFTLTDRRLNTVLTRACPSVSSNGNMLTLDAMSMQNIYGLGEQFQTPGEPNGDWSGKIRVPGNKYGNTMTHFAGGNTGNAQFPILYALGPNHLNYAFFLDTVYPHSWDFTKSPWTIQQTMKGTDPSFRGYFFFGKDVPALRSAYMDLVGHPLVPPKKAFGLWVSEFGYRNWGEIEDKITTLRKNHFPIDGFVLDLYWFGQYHEHDVNSAMGTLTWDTKNFPAPANRIARFKNDDGVGIMTIEESYVSSGLTNFSVMNSHQYFVSQFATPENPMIFDSWWGKGGGIDWSNPDAGALWHNSLRKKQLTDMGVTFHWTDLGEPEAWDDNDYYRNNNGIGHAEQDAHNLYNFYWDKSIHDGYVSNHETERHFIMSRSGSPGIQRFGAAMWSGDIGSNMDSLAGHLNVQMNMSLSGMDYFGADIGGFNRTVLVGDVGEVYTRWFADASVFDVPMRPHTDDGSKQNFTSPDRIGDIWGNRVNLRQRYELAPYYYSLAYQAYRKGQAVVPPLVYYFQDDQNVRQIADEKMVGPFLLAAATSTLGQTTRDVYLPAGDWIDYRNMQWYHSQGQTYPNVSIYNQKFLQIPIFASAGAILPKALVDDRTMNILGKRTDGTVDSDLRLRVFAGVKSTSFNLVEDDNVTESYQGGAFAETLITQVLSGKTETVNIAGTTGSYNGAAASRRVQVEFIAPEKLSVGQVRLNGTALNWYKDAKGMQKNGSGWYTDAQGVIHMMSAPIDVRSAKQVDFAIN